MKFYFAELTYRQTGKKVYKFGLTWEGDADNRFTLTYPERENYKLFNIRILFSMNFYRKEDAEKYEKNALAKYPRCNVAQVVGASERFSSANLTGISEFRNFSSSEVDGIIDHLYKRRKELIGQGLVRPVQTYSTVT